MKKRYSNKDTRKKEIEKLSNQLDEKIQEILSITNLDSKKSIEAKIGSKIDKAFNLVYDIIESENKFIKEYFEWLNDNQNNDVYKICKNSSAREYVEIFLRKAFVTHYKEYSRKKLKKNEAYLWLGKNTPEYGLFVTPTYLNERWNNDRSEIRKFSEAYWSIGHLLKIGLRDLTSENEIKFREFDDFFDFANKNLLLETEFEAYKNYYKYVIKFKKIKEKKIIPLLLPGVYTADLKNRSNLLLINPITFEKHLFDTNAKFNNIENTLDKIINSYGD